MTDRTPARQVNIGHDHAAVFAVQDGDLHVHQRIGTHLIDELTFGAVPVLTEEQPSRLLTVGNRVVSFTGRDAEIAGLTTWRDSPTAVAVRLVHGGAGQGKTRLAHRIAEISRSAGWITLRARHSRDVAVQPVETPAGTAVAASGRLLVVVDYAERWPLSDLLALLLDRRLHGSPALRVLLLARPVGNWWHALTYRLSQSLGASADSVELAPLGATGAGSRAAFDVARSCFAKALGVADPGHPAPEIEGSVLTIHMAALAHVLAARHGDTPPTDPGHLSAYLLSRERSHWQAMYDNDRRIESTPQVMGRAVHVAALTRPLDYADAVATLQSAGVADSATAGQVLDDHAMCYPPQDPATLLEPLYPDRLAEDFVALQTPGHTVPGFRADPWATGGLAALTAPGSRNAPAVLPVLIEAARRWPHLTDRHLVPLLKQRPELAVQAGSPALSAIAASPRIPLDVLAAIEAALPGDPPQDLFAGIAAVTERLVGDLTRAENNPDPVRASRLLQKLGWRLLDSGRVTHGIAMLTAAVAAARRLPGDDHVGLLEFALRTAGRAHARVKDWPNAVATLGEAVDLWNRHGLTAGLPPEEVAGCLADLSLALWHTDEVVSSLSVRHRALQRLRRLVAGDPRHRITLIRTLVQQAEQLRRGERRDDALEALDEALEVLRAVGGEAVAGLELDFGAALLGRAKTLLSLGRLTEAEPTVSWAVRLFRQLAGLNVAYDPDLARALEAQADILARLQRWPGALEAQDGATAIYRRLTRVNAERYGLDLVRKLIRTGRLCRDSGHRQQDGLAALTEAIRLLQPGRHEPGVSQRLLSLAQSLAADLLDADGRHEDADTLRPPAPVREARQNPRRPVFTVQDAHRGKAMLELSPFLARLRLEQLPPQDIAATLVAMRNPRPLWLIQMFTGFQPGHGRQILWWLVQHEQLTQNSVVLRFAAKLLMACPPPFTADALVAASPVTAAAILSYDEWTYEANRVLILMDHVRLNRILRLLAYDPFKGHRP